MFGTADDEEPVEKIIMTSSSAFIIPQDSTNNNFVIIMVDSGASDHLFDDAIIRDLKHCLQGYAHLATPRKILTARGALLDVTAEGVLQGLIADNYGNQILVRVDTVVVHGMGRNLFSVITAAKKGIVAIFGHANSRLEEVNVTVPLRSESGDLYLFVLDLSADGYSVKELATNTVANAQVRHRRLGHSHLRSLDILRKGDGIGITFEGTVSDCNVCAVGKAQQLAHPKTANNKVDRTFWLCYGNLKGPFTPPVAIGGYKYVSEVTD